MDKLRRAICEGMPGLVKLLGREDIVTLEALCTRLTGDLTSGMMLARLFRWWPKAGRRDGWVWKSYRDWWAELAIPQHRITRAKGALRHAGVDIVVKGAQGRAQTHYRLNTLRFFRRLAALLKVAVHDVWTICRSMMQGIVDLWIDKTSLSNTNKTPNETANNTNVVVGIFKGEIPTIILRVKGMLEKTARTLIWRYGLERLVAICEYVMGQTNLYNPVGFIRSELREDRLGLKDRPPRSEQLALELEDGERYVMGQFADFIYH